MTIPVTSEELQQLSLPAIVAFATRAARRYQPRFDLPPDYTDRVLHFKAVEEAIGIAEHWPSGGASAREFDTAAEAARSAATRAAYIAVRAADSAVRVNGDAAADLLKKSKWFSAARDAANAAASAAQTADYARAARGAAGRGSVESRHTRFAKWVAAAAGHANATAFAASDKVAEITEMARADFQRLIQLSAEMNSESAVDASETGPLGPLWPDKTPKWFVEGQLRMRAVLSSASGEADQEGVGGLLKVVLSIPDGAAKQEIAAAVRELAAALDAEHRRLGGHGLRIDTVQVRSPVAEVVPGV